MSDDHECDGEERLRALEGSIGDLMLQKLAGLTTAVINEVLRREGDGGTVSEKELGMIVSAQIRASIDRVKVAAVCQALPMGATADVFGHNVEHGYVWARQFNLDDAAREENGELAKGVVHHLPADERYLYAPVTT